MERIKEIIRAISASANDPNSTLESILSEIAEGVYGYFQKDERKFNNVMSYIVRKSVV